MISILLEPHWRTVAAVNPGHKVQSDITKTRVQRFAGYTLRPIEERTERRDSGRYPMNVLPGELYD